MANREQVAMLRRSVAEWNEWRQRNQGVVPDLRGADLRGCDLRGANLVKADIRSAKFGRRGKNEKAADLTGADLSEAWAGVLWQFVLLQLLIILVVSALSGFLSGFSGWYAAAVFSATGWTIADKIAVGAALAIVYPATFFAIARQGFTFKAAGTIATAFAFAFALAVAVAVAVAGAGAGAGAGASFLLGLYAARRAKRGDKKFELTRQLGLALTALGGTDFTDTNLTKAIFKKTKLKSTTFHNATLTHTNFRNAQQLPKANPGNSLLSNFQILDLLTTPDGHYGKNLSGMNFRGAYLADANLESATLTNTDLAEADLTGASLKNANLREANCIGATFTRAYFTGACLESWNIDNTTVFENVDCQHIFLLEKENLQGSRERRPHDPSASFNPGDFEKLFSEASNLVEVLIRDGLDREAFGKVFQELMDKFGITPAHIKGIEKKGTDVLVTVEVSEETDKGDMEKTLRVGYEKQLAILTAERDAARLEASKADQQTRQERQEKQQLLGILGNFADRPVAIKNEINNPIHNEPTAMSNSESGRTINTGGGDYRETNVSEGGQYAERDIINQGQSGTTREEILDLLAAIENKIHTRTDLPEELKQKSIKYLGAATEEAKEEEPDKEFMGKSLKKMGGLFKEAGATTKAAVDFGKAIAPAMKTIGTWLGMALF